MKNFIFITGGARSGKSKLAENIAKDITNRVLYIATAIAFDDGMRDRIEKHRKSRPDKWATVEKYRDFINLTKNEDFIHSDLILMDCMTLMVSNLLLESSIDFDNSTSADTDKIENEIIQEISELLNIIKSNNKSLIIVSNEVGMGLVPAYKLGSVFRDIAGRVNQYLAQEAETVYLTVSGIPLKIK